MERQQAGPAAAAVICGTADPGPGESGGADPASIVAPNQAHAAIYGPTRPRPLASTIDE